MNSELGGITHVRTGRDLRDHPNSSFCVPVKKPCMWQQKENQEKLPLEFYMCRNIFQKTLIFYNIIEGNIRVY